MADQRGAFPPGWYDDPAFPGRHRWWDGTSWAPPGAGPGAVPGDTPGGMGPGGMGPSGMGPSVGGPPGPAGYGAYPPFPQYPPRPQLQLDLEQATGQRAKIALWAGAGMYAISVTSQAFYLHEFWLAFDKTMQAISTTSRSGRTSSVAPDPFASMSSGAKAAQTIGQFAGLALLVVGVLFVIWFHRALTNAGSLGLPARRSPGWGVVGFIIPIVNFWFPYQSACDLFPPGHPDRKLVGRWWAFWLTAQLSTYVLFAVALASQVAGLVVAALISVLYVLAAHAARTMIDRSHEVHADLALAAGFPVGPGSMPFPGPVPGGLSGPMQGAPSGPVPGWPPGGTMPAPGAPPGAGRAPGAGPPPGRDPWNPDR